jgi:hypothetical protein
MILTSEKINIDKPTRTTDAQPSLFRIVTNRDGNPYPPLPRRRRA